LIVHALALAAALSATPPPSLGAAQSFSILGGSGVANTGPTRVTGNVGTASGAVTGFPPATIVPGVGKVVDDAGDAPKDLGRAWDQLQLAAPPCPSNSPNTLPDAPDPGIVYCASAVPDTLTFKGNEDAVWIIRITGPLTTSSDSSMQLPGGAQSSHIFWQVFGTATLGERSSFVGNLLTNDGITVGKGVTVSGRLLARQGPVTLATDDINLCCDPIAQSPLPNGTEKVPYNETIVPGGGVAPHTFSLFAQTEPPPGLHLDSSGLVHGVPESAGSYTFTVLVQDYNGCTSIHTYTIVICGIVPELIRLTEGTVGKFHGEIIGAGGSSFRLIDMPAWLSPITDQCFLEVVVSGTPTAEGPYTFKMVDCDSGCIIRIYTIDVHCPAITFTPPTLPGATVGTPYKEGVEATGGTAPYRYEPSSEVSFTPAKQGRYYFPIKATDVYGCIGEHVYTVDVVCSPIIDPESLPPAIANVPYSVQLTASPPGSYQFASTDLPAWLTLSDNGRLSGIPPGCGDYVITVMFVDPASGCSGSITRVLHVSCCPTITISPAALPHGTVFVFYNKVLTITGGTPPYTVIPATAGPLSLTPTITPNGNVTVSGLPIATGIITFTVIATDSNGCSGSQMYQIVIRQPLVPGPVIPALSEWMLLLLAIVVAGIAVRRMS
jgi:hypothetical protein